MTLNQLLIAIAKNVVKQKTVAAASKTKEGDKKKEGPGGVDSGKI